MPSRCEKWTSVASRPKKLFLKPCAAACKPRLVPCEPAPNHTVLEKRMGDDVLRSLFFSFTAVAYVSPYFESIFALYLISFSSSCLLQMEAKIVSWMNFDLECHQTIEARLEILHELPPNLSRDLQRHLYRWIPPMQSTPPETFPGPFLQQQDILLQYLLVYQPDCALAVL
jgi:hypothetical protein